MLKVNDLQALEAAIRPNTKVIYAESLGNPNSDVADFEGIAAVAHRHNIVFIVDNTFAPVLIRPLEKGAAAFVTRIRAVLLRDTGAAISPFNAWILLQGVETLPLRIERHTQNALKVVEYLSRHPKVAKVNHPALPDHPDHAHHRSPVHRGGTH